MHQEHSPTIRRQGRPAKLSPETWKIIERRVTGGEGVRAIAREYGIHPSGISRRIPQQAQHVRDLAQRLAEVNRQVAALPVRQQHLVVQLADELQEVHVHLASAAIFGASTAHLLAAHADRVLNEGGMSEPTLKAVAAMTKTVNEAAATGLALLARSPSSVVCAAGEPEPQPQCLKPTLIPIVRARTAGSGAS